MADVKEWTDVISKMGTDECERYAKDIRDLMNWDMFKKEYEWTRLGTVATMLEREVKGRAKERWAIWASRSNLSIFGPAEAWCKSNGEVEIFDTEDGAQAKADYYNEHTTPNVWYEVREYRQ